MNGGIADWVARRAARKGSAIAVVDADAGRSLSYADLHEAAGTLAGGLHERGVRRGDRVALLMENSAEFVTLLFAVASLGAVTVPLNFRLGPAEIEYVLADSGAVVLIVSDRFRELAKGALAGGGTRVSLVVVTSEARDGAEVGGVPAIAWAALAGSAGFRVHDTALHDDDLCMIMYTSGTTGHPKGAMLTHGNMLWNAVNTVTIGTGYCGGTTTLAIAPMFHIGALGLSVLPVLYAGGTVVTVGSFDAARTLALMAEHRVTTQFMVPAMWAALAAVPNFDSYEISTVEFVLCGGAPCPIPVIEFYRQRGWAFLEGFGMTEASPNTLLLDADFVLTHAGSVGRPFLHVDVRIVDERDDEVVPGDVGELVIRGPNVFAGYWGLPEATAAAMRRGWFHSGDLARQDENGFITLVDRKKDMIITGGENVYPVEVEQLMHRHPGVSDVAVVGIPDERWGETVLALVVPAENDPPDADDVISYCRSRIAHFKCPRRVEFVEELPRTATGKILKRELRARFGNGSSAVSR